MNSLCHLVCLLGVGSTYGRLTDDSVEILQALLLAHSPAALQRYRMGGLRSSNIPTMATSVKERILTETWGLDNLQASPGSNKQKNRKGRGDAAGQGQTCGFGNDGMKARSGPGVRPGFEGGQTPTYRKLPKYVGRPMGPGYTRKAYNLIKMDTLSKLPAESDVTIQSLLDARLISKAKKTFGTKKLFKVVGHDDATPAQGLTVRAHAFTEGARKAIEANGGKAILISETKGEDIVEGDEAE
jgi:large subunit ribosomal protein L15